MTSEKVTYAMQMAKVHQQTEMMAQNVLRISTELAKEFENTVDFRRNTPYKRNYALNYRTSILLDVVRRVLDGGTIPIPSSQEVAQTQQHAHKH